MKKVLLIAVAGVIAISMYAVSQGYSRSRDGHGLVPVEWQMNKLLAEHQKYLETIFNRRFDPFDKAFFTDMGFMDNVHTVHFFKTLQADIESGNIPRNEIVQASYTNMTYINGKISGVTYQYTTNGKNVTLIKDTYNNGTMLKAVYYYDISGKLLNAREFRGNELINEDSRKLTI
jgi:hypothetical protein